MPHAIDNNGYSSITKILETLRFPCNKHTLDEAILQLCVCNPFIQDSKASKDVENLPDTQSHIHTKHIPNPQILHDLAEILAQRIFELLESGTICELEYIGIFWVLKHIDTPFVDTRFLVFLEQMQSLLFSDGLSELENILFLQVCSVAHIFVYGADSGMEFFIAHMCLLDMDLAQSEGIAEFCIKYFPLLGVDFDVCLRALMKALDSAMNLTPRRRRSLLNWQLHCLWNIQGYFNTTRWLELYPSYEAVFYALLDRVRDTFLHDKECALGYLDEALYMQFFIYHICGNSFHTQEQWQEFCEKIDRKAVAVYEIFAPYMRECVSITPHKHTKEIIGIIKDRIVGNSPYKVEFSLFQNLLRTQAFSSRFCIKIYNMAFIEKSADDENLRKELENLGIEICDVAKRENIKGFYNSHLNKALLLWEAIRADSVRYLISPNNGYGISDFLLSVRVAPIQMYYSHGNFVYDIPFLTQRLTHICNAQKRIQHCGFEFVGVPVKMDKRFYNPHIDSHIINALRLQYPSESKILGTIGRLVKIDSSQYLQSVLYIMRHYPQSIYLACGGGNESAIREKIIREGGLDLLDRFYFVGYVDSALYGHIIDIWLDSFPLEQGESRIEYVAKGGVALVLSRESKQERISRISRWVDQYAEILSEFLTLYNTPSANISQIQTIMLTSLADIKTLLCECMYVAFDIQEYEHKALELLQSQSIEAVRAHSLLEREILDFVREKIGTQSFLELLDSLSGKD